MIFLRKCLPHIGLCVFFLIVGIAIGIIISPNYMRIHVDPVGKLNVGAQNGDILEWDQLGTDMQPYPIQITFSCSSKSFPCNRYLWEKKGICIVKYPNQKSAYRYTCPGPTPGVSYCDPNVGPASALGGGGIEKGSLKSWWISVLGSVKVWSLQSSISSSGAPDRAASRRDDPEAYVDCDDNNPSKTEVSNDIFVGAGKPFLWLGQNGPGGFTLSDIYGADGALANICKNGDWKTTKKCDVQDGIKGMYAYTATDNSCSVSPKANIQVN
jgi:hypothetical protein